MRYLLKWLSIDFYSCCSFKVSPGNLCTEILWNISCGSKLKYFLIDRGGKFQKKKSCVLKMFVTIALIKPTIAFEFMSAIIFWIEEENKKLDIYCGQIRHNPSKLSSSTFSMNSHTSTSSLLRLSIRLPGKSDSIHRTCWNYSQPSSDLML